MTSVPKMRDDAGRANPLVVLAALAVVAVFTAALLDGNLAKSAADLWLWLVQGLGIDGT